jgi:hypothetical protein
LNNIEEFFDHMLNSVGYTGERPTFKERKFAKSSTDTIYYSMVVPIALDIFLTMYYPDLFDEDIRKLGGRKQAIIYQRVLACLVESHFIYANMDGLHDKTPFFVSEYKNGDRTIGVWSYIISCKTSWPDFEDED